MSKPKPQILVVEDNRAMARVISVVLESAGYRVTVAFDGEAGWTEATNENFDLIITDQQMPKLNGVDLCRRLRSHDQYKSTPIFMLTAKGLELDLTALKDELGISEVFGKPFSPSMITKYVEQCFVESAVFSS